MQIRSALDAAGQEAKRSASEAQQTLDSALDRLYRSLRAKVDVTDLLSRLYAKIRR
jgi:hypothetical protein